ncbi:hypothetical protein FQN55_004686 [Onygenales sp. PD_40]|nr:hypothetical protein FQN55_004686 [Onygenales sp. PD_40]KAK2779215.1 hypothetical protein FQN52_002511 [Onygenales sp. PD_12]KAK2786067.1 hypothetical protein FQN53_006976 [Emmonsiellopsis sp. PD_33]KAK2799224.1 hypothetical protein FQN51_007054 [Onygenales sp. PD_10]
MSRVVNLALRTIELIFAVIIMALIGNMISDAYHDSAATVNYCLFVSAFTMLTLFYLFAAAISDTFMVHPSIVFIVDVLNLIFVFCAAIALPSKLRVHSCSNKEYTSKNSITRDAPSEEKRCREAQASTAFLWFLWAAFLASTVISGLGLRGTMVDMRGPRPGRRGRPSMSQV